jgi:anti-sigma regulatory factor (Ser/Thr protein kinase)
MAGVRQRRGRVRFARQEWTKDDADVRLSLPEAEAESAGLVRHVLGGLTGALALDAETVAGIRLAVTEACTNVVRHAYANGTGPLDVRIRTSSEEVQVDVRDRGPGIAPRPGRDSLGLGLPLIAALSDGMRIFRDEDGWTVLALRFTRA